MVAHAMPSVPERAAEAVSQVREHAKRSLSRRMPFPPALEDIVSQVLLEGLARAALPDGAGSSPIRRIPSK